jgi:putative oxidoreductase
MHIQLPLWFLVVGRILFVSYFMAMGTSHLLKFQEHSAHLARKGVPLPRAATILTVIMMVGGGVLVLFNWHSGLGAVLLFGIIFPAPFYLHRFWNETDWYLRLSEFAHFIKDFSLAGAALLLLSGRMAGF